MIIKTTSGDVNIKGSTGDTTFNSVSGDLNIDYTKFDNNINISTSSGDSKLTLSEDSQFYLNFKSSSGRVKNAFPITVNGTAKRNNIEGTVISDHNKIIVKTSSGGLEIIK